MASNLLTQISMFLFFLQTLALPYSGVRLTMIHVVFIPATYYSRRPLSTNYDRMQNHHTSTHTNKQIFIIQLVTMTGCTVSLLF